uniref:Putative uncharacterized protein CsgH n=1 Tax=Rhodopseudomonas palustris (strain DX-1) TaxID=652103 RepID=UPI0007C42B68|nr:Chain A, Solution Structure of R. palustris CsgH [Rhodopseudomonas palustris DX-1]
MVQCEVEAAVSGGHVTLQGVITAVRDGAGSYKLAVDKAGAAGTSRIKQAGAFTAIAEQRVTVGNVVLDYSSANRYAARLDVSFGSVTIQCNLDPETVKLEHHHHHH